MKIREIKAKSIMVKSAIPGSDFVINPYTGCMHGCVYCYARFMKRFTDHKELWGRFVDVKVNGPELVPEKWKGGSILLSSVTDPYQPLEMKYEITRKILEKLVSFQPDLCVLTKSDLVLRDVDILKRFRRCMVGFSVSVMDENIRREVEIGAPTVERRVDALRMLKESGLRNFLFISPILPEVTDWKEIISRTKDFVDEFWFENLNVKGDNWPYIKSWLKSRYPHLLEKYERIYFTRNDYWRGVEKDIKIFCEKNGLEYKIYFHH